MTPWTAAHQAYLSITNSWSLLRLTSIESVMPSSHLILCRPLLLLPSIFPSIKVFSSESSSHQVARVNADSFLKIFLLLILCCCCRFSRVQLFVTPETVAHQAPLSLGFSRQKYWSGFPFPSPMHACMLNCFSHVRLCVTPWTAALQAPLSTGLSRQEYRSGLPFPSPT